jgi:hypothetical protein
VKLRIFLLGLILALSSSAARATTFTAATSLEATVATDVLLAQNGDTVQIPCSPSSSVWTTPLVVTKNITITGLGATPNSGPSTTGSGANCLTLVDGNPSGPIIELEPTYSSSSNVVTLQNMNIDPQTGLSSLTDPVWAVGTCTSSGCPNLHVDNVWFGYGSPWSESTYGSSSEAAILAEMVFGVLDHNTLCTSGTPCTAPVGFELFNAEMGSYLGVGQYGDNSWAQPDSFGGPNNLFAENNLDYNAGYLAMTDCEQDDSFTNRGGCRFVLRYNTMYAGSANNGGYGLAQDHGTDSGGRARGTREMEIYGNIYHCLGTTQGCSAIDGATRSGSVLVFNNQAIFGGGSYGGYWFNLAIYRNVASWSAPFTYCGGAGANDQNDGTTYFSGTATGGGAVTMTDTSQSWSTNQFNNGTGSPYSVYDVSQGFYAEIVSNTSNSITVEPSLGNAGNANPWSGFNAGDSYQVVRATLCIDQPARGQGNYISGNTPAAGWVGEVLDPVYRWGDTATGGNVNQGGVVAPFTNRVIANRDYYDQASGVQVSATSPFNGTHGTGWGTLVNRPTSCTTGVGYFATDQGNWNQSGSGTQGELYTCTAPNNWSFDYEPYTYPHPLAGGGTSTPGSGVVPPTGITIQIND